MADRSQTYPDWLEIQPVTGPVNADVQLPGSKSYTNRALIIAALADGESELTGALFSDDTRVMIDSLHRLGIPVVEDAGNDRFLVHGQSGAIPQSEAPLFIGNSGTSARFLAALCALGHGTYRIDGIERMRQRPMNPLLDALQHLGVDASSDHQNGCPPITIDSDGLRGGHVSMPGDTSSQYFSALMMAAPCTDQGIEVDVSGDLVSKPYIDMTIDTMDRFGARVHHEQYQRISVPGRQMYQSRKYAVEPDASAASYFFALAAVTGGTIKVLDLGSGSAQGDAKFVDVLEQMGCTVIRELDSITVTGPTQLHGVDVDMNAISDTMQTLAAIAPFATGPVHIHNISHVRHKETDRIEAVASELRRLGVRVTERRDGLSIYPGKPVPGRIRTYDDHRMAMSFAILGTVQAGIEIDDPGCVAKTFPTFFEVLGETVGRSQTK